MRSMKTSGASKEVWQPHVTVLLEMKKKLAAMKGEPEVTNKTDKSSKKVSHIRQFSIISSD